MAGKQASNQDIMDAINGIRRDFATKDDLKGMEHRLVRKIDALRRSNTQHHLRTREEVGYLNGKLGDIQEGLKQAAGLV